MIAMAIYLMLMVVYIHLLITDTVFTAALVMAAEAITHHTDTAADLGIITGNVHALIMPAAQPRLCVVRV